MPYLSTFLVPPGASPSTIRWNSPTSRVNVAIRSELGIDPALMTWTAWLDCDVSGGPAESLTMSLPSEWADAATLEIEGSTHRIVAQAGPPSSDTIQWKILPESPIWGRARLILRSSRPLRPGAEFAYPQVSPMSATGRGSLGRYELAIRNGSGFGLDLGRSSGLEATETSRFNTMDAASSTRPIDRAYRVTGNPWSLRLKIGRAGESAASTPGLEETRVAWEQLDCVHESDGTAWGRARYDLEPHPGSFLAVELPEGATIPWASVEDVVRPSLVEHPGRWLIPLGDQQPRKVTLAWRVPGNVTSHRSGRPWVRPRLDRPANRSLISVQLPEGLELSTSGSGIEALSRSAWEVAQVEQLARRVEDGLSQFDPESSRDRQLILEGLSDAELRVRQAGRIALGMDRRVVLLSADLQRAIDAIAEASEVSGGSELVQQARARIGAGPAIEDQGEALTGWPVEIIRLRGSGRSRFFRATVTEGVRPEAILWVATKTDSRIVTASAWGFATAGITLWLGIAAFITRGLRPTGRLSISIVALTMLALLAWEPLGILGLLGLFGWGRLES